MKKSRYISKYDYLAYYTKQPAMWFFSNTEIKAAIDYELSKCKNVDNDIDDDEESVDDNEIDAYDYYKESIFDIQNAQNEYQEFLKSTQKIDENNILMVQGNILDKWSKEHIKNEYSEFNCLIIDYDDNEYRNKSSDYLFELTKKDLFNNQNIILFQPTFIWKEKGLITKCDALVKINNDIFIIETKGTSSTKIIHVFDLFYQHKVVENSINEINDNNTFIYNYRLCIIDYIKAPIFTAPFSITDSSGLGKSPIACPQKDKSLETKRNCKRGIRIKENYDYTSYFNDIFTWTIDGINELKEEKLINSKEAETRTKIVGLFADFDYAIQQLKNRKELLEHRESQCPNHKPDPFVPSYQDKGDLKNTDFWMDLRKLYVAKGYDVLGYSGNLLKINGQILNKLKPNITVNELFTLMKENDNNIAKQQEEYEMYFAKHLPNFNVDYEAWEYHLSQLKDKKVYFDFESINTAIRAVDNSTPFLQAITQCSIIKDHNDGTPISEVQCLNMCRHPRKIDIPWMKEVIDNLYEGPNYSYVVFNKSFEKTRLKEMAEFIGETEYYNKVQCINDNIVDLAEWYNYKGKKLDSNNPKSPKIKCPIIVKQLHGFYSIKKVLPLVNMYNPNIYKETKCVSYIDGLLTVHNGSECQTETTKYFFEIPTEMPWKQFLASIECYCENDVRAMIAVEYLAKDIAKNPQYYNDLARKIGY